MKNKKLIIIFIICIIFVVGCGKKDNGDYKGELFNVQTAKITGLNYMQRLLENDIEGANSISAPEVAANNTIKKIINEPIIAFSPGDITETGNSAYINFNVVRMNEQDKGTNLDKYILKIEKNGDDYKVSDVGSENSKQIYYNGDEIRSITKGAGDSELILRIKDLPLEIYPKEEKVPIQKVKVPKDKFGVMSIDFKGSEIAVTTTNGKDTFIGTAMVEEAQQTMAQMSSDDRMAQDGKKGVDENTLRKILEKPVAQKILGYDILKDCTVKKMLFTEEGSELIVQYTKGNNPNIGLKIYKNPDGEPLKIDFEKLFPMDKYDVNFKGGSQSKLIITVNTSSKNKDIYQDILGDYVIDLIEEEVFKM
ncbi:MAG: hypothetical protein ACRCVJ_10580 [Clostridium sp.]|uniref:hypothetical protein n=1 Tax=Clostridium sp. TaxID=1506 RepID=UPI003F394338